MKRTYKVGIVGFGGQGYSHTKTIAEIENIEVGGIYDIADARIDFAGEKGFHAYKSYDEMLSDPEIDIITVATPNDSHHPLTVAALRAGKHVVCEKPAAMNSNELADMIRVANECGRIFTVHQNRRYDADFRVMKKIYDEGELGPVHRFERRVQGCNGIPKDWRSQPEFGGGMMLDWGVHLLDQTLQLIPEKIKKVYCRLEHVTNELCDDGVTVWLTFESGLLAVVEVATSNFIELPHWYMLGRDGSAIIRGWKANDGEIVKSVGEAGEVEPVLTASGITKTMAPRREDTIKRMELPTVETDLRDFYRNVMTTIEGKTEQAISNDSVTRVFKLMEAAFRSAELNETVDFE